MLDRVLWLRFFPSYSSSGRYLSMNRTFTYHEFDEHAIQVSLLYSIRVDHAALCTVLME